MSISAIESVSDRILKLIEDAIKADDPTSAAPRVVLDDPVTAMDKKNANLVSLWLYHVAIDEFSRNATPRGFDDPTLGRRRFALPPLGLDLFYLVTPIQADKQREQHTLSVVMLALYENATLSVTQTDSEVYEQIRISLQTGPFDERIRLWESLGKPHRLSVGYQIRSVRLASKRLDNSAPITATTTGLADQSVSGSS